MISCEKLQCARKLFGFTTLLKALEQRCWGLKGKLISRFANRAAGTLSQKGATED